MFRSIQSRQDAKALLQSPSEGEPNPRAALRELAKRHLSRSEFVAIDASFEDAATVIASLPRDVPCALLPANNGLRALLAALSGRTIDVLHLFCDGTVDGLSIGDELIELGTPIARDAALLDMLRTSFSHASAESPSIQLYGSPFGLGAAGRAAASTLARLTATSVAASVDATQTGPEDPTWHLQLVRSSDNADAAGSVQQAPVANQTPNEIPQTVAHERAAFELGSSAMTTAKHTLEPMADVSLHNPRVQFHRAVKEVEADQNETTGDEEPDGLAAFSAPANDFPIAAGKTPHLAPEVTAAVPVAEYEPGQADVPSPDHLAETELTALTLQATVRPNDMDAEVTIAELGDADGEVRLVLDGPLLTFGVSRMPAYAEAVADLSVLGIEDYSSALLTIAATVDQTGWLKLYVRGALAGTGRLAPRDLRWTVRTEAPDTSDFDGEIAVLRLYDNALAASQIVGIDDRSEPLDGMVWQTGTLAHEIEKDDAYKGAELDTSAVLEVADEPIFVPIAEDGQTSTAEAATNIDNAEPTTASVVLRQEPRLPTLRSSARVRALAARGDEIDARERSTTVKLRSGGELRIDAPKVAGCALGDAVAFWIVRGPEWVKLNARTGELHGDVPAMGEVGAHPIIVVAANDRGATATLHLVVVVEAVMASTTTVEDRLRSSLDSLPALRALSAAGRAVAPLEDQDERTA